MSAYENAVQSLVNGGYPDRQAREILSFVCGEAQNEGHRRGAAAARAELEAEFVAWLVKKAREHRAQGRQYAKQADVIGRLADKVSRGAVRPNNLLSLPAQGGPEDVPELLAKVDRLRARVAELEALTPARFQDCPKCGAGYEYGQPCPSCEFKARVDAERAAVDRSITDQYPATAADKWNALHPVGTPVTAYPGCRPEDDPKCTRLVTRTRSTASVLGGHTAVVWVDGHSSCISLTHVDPTPGGAS